MKAMSFQIEETHQTARLISSHIIFKFQNTRDKKKIPQASRGEKKGDLIQSIKNQNGKKKKNQNVIGILNSNSRN